MKFQSRRVLALLAFLCSAAVSPWASADAPTADAPGSADHPLLARFPGSVLIGYQQMQWEQTTFPSSMKIDKTQKDEFVNPVVVEGKITRAFYLGQLGKSRLEVFRNYQDALMKAGLQVKVLCETNCVDIIWHYKKFGSGFSWTKGDIPDTKSGRYGLMSALSTDEIRVLYGVLNRNGQQVHVAVATTAAAYTSTNRPAMFVEIAEPKAMTTGQVTVNLDAVALQAGLQNEGKVALYGIYFDTGKSELKAESKGQLDEMAKLLQSQPALKVYIVGHTDNQGALDPNVTLSQQRAQAVASALAAAPYKIDARRMVARGVASLAPVASNAADDGRARNRRVELVLQ
jgi:OmpA-OmpF porin, OOP family